MVSGTIINYDSDAPQCAGQDYTAPAAFMDAGGNDVHMLRNNGSEPAETIAVQLIPSGQMRLHAVAGDANHRGRMASGRRSAVRAIGILSNACVRHAQLRLDSPRSSHPPWDDRRPRTDGSGSGPLLPIRRSSRCGSRLALTLVLRDVVQSQ